MNVSQAADDDELDAARRVAAFMCDMIKFIFFIQRLEFFRRTAALGSNEQRGWTARISALKTGTPRQQSLEKILTLRRRDEDESHEHAPFFLLSCFALLFFILFRIAASSPD